jgi:hypothetical protein
MAGKKSNTVQSVVVNDGLMIVDEHTRERVEFDYRKLKDITLDHIYDFIDHGDLTASNDPNLAIYLQLLEKVRLMMRSPARFGGRDMIIKHLIKVDGFSRHVAVQLYEDSFEYFNSVRNISRDAYRHWIAEEMKNTILMAREICTNSKDLLGVVKGFTDLARVLKLDEPDPEVKEIKAADPWIIYTTDAESLGLPNVSRTRLKEQIEKLPDLPERTKRMIMREAQVLPVKVFLDPSEDARKD